MALSTSATNTPRTERSRSSSRQSRFFEIFDDHPDYRSLCHYTACSGASSIFGAWPANDDETGGPLRKPSETPTQSLQGRTSDTFVEHNRQDQGPGEEYMQCCSREGAAWRLQCVKDLEECVEHCTTPEERRAEVLAQLEHVYGEGHSEYEAMYAVYMYHHPEDLPTDIDYDEYRELRERALWTHSGRVREDDEESEEPFEIAPRQRELFGCWTWPSKRSSKADYPVDLGPRDEKVPIAALPPAGYTWKELRKGRHLKQARSALPPFLTDVKDQLKKIRVRPFFSNINIHIRSVGRRLNLGKFRERDQEDCKTVGAITKTGDHASGGHTAMSTYELPRMNFEYRLDLGSAIV